MPRCRWPPPASPPATCRPRSACRRWSPSPRRFKAIDDGKVADYIPALAAVPRDLFGVVRGRALPARVHAVGDTEHAFSIQSVSKPFVFALVCQALGDEEARAKLGVNSTGLPFNSVMAIELQRRPHHEPDGQRRRDRRRPASPPARRPTRSGDSSSDGLSRFAGRALELDDEVYASEAATNQRNQGIAQPAARATAASTSTRLKPPTSTPGSARSNVTADDLAVMGATLANGGVNPLTGERVIDGVTASRCWR